MGLRHRGPDTGGCPPPYSYHRRWVIWYKYIYLSYAYVCMYVNIYWRRPTAITSVGSLYSPTPSPSQAGGAAGTAPPPPKNGLGAQNFCSAGMGAPGHATELFPCATIIQAIQRLRSSDAFPIAFLRIVVLVNGRILMPKLFWSPLGQSPWTGPAERRCKYESCSKCPFEVGLVLWKSKKNENVQRSTNVKSKEV